MITVTPEGSVYICKTPLEKDYKHQLTFTNVTSQTSYFASKVVKSYADFTYVKKDGYITVNENIDVIRDANYLFYKNTGFSDRIFYCFITKMEYMNENATRIYFKTDVFQTYYFNIEYKQCFVEREHVADDSAGKHTIPEGLDCGEYVINQYTKVMDCSTDPWLGGDTGNPHSLFLVMGVTEAPSSEISLTLPSGHMYDGLYQGLYFLAFTDSSQLENAIKMYGYAGKNDAIYCIFTCPKEMVDISTFVTPQIWQYVGQSITLTSTMYYIASSTGGESACKLLSNATVRPSYDIIHYGEENEYYSFKLDGYHFKNNKLMTYPYSYVYATNNAGGDTVYRFEDFLPSTHQKSLQTIPQAKFNAYGSFGVVPCTKLVPLNYKKNNGTSLQPISSFAYGLAGQKFPASSWASDYFTNWLTQNGTNIATNILASTIRGTANGSVVSAKEAVISGALSAVTSTLQAVGEVDKASKIPDQYNGNANTGDLNYSSGNNGWTICVMSIRNEYAKIIDNFFTMYGYKVNTVKTPSITGRAYWNYVKTIDCNVEGDIPQDDLMEIRNIFNNGCTFWHDPTKMFDYSLTNSIIS